MRFLNLLHSGRSTANVRFEIQSVGANVVVLVKNLLELYFSAFHFTNPICRDCIILESTDVMKNCEGSVCILIDTLTMPYVNVARLLEAR